MNSFGALTSANNKHWFSHYGMSEALCTTPLSERLDKNVNQ